MVEQKQKTDLREKQKWKRQQIFGLSTFIVALSVAIVLLVAGKSQKAEADQAAPQIIQAPQNSFGDAAPVKQTGELALNDVRQPIQDSMAAVKTTSPQDAIPTTDARNIANVDEGICKNPEVNLTDKQAEFVLALGDFLAARGVTAIVTSGKRTSEGQLDIIKQRIEEHGVSSKFPALQQASVADTKIWLKAWNWLRARRVPVNAPAEVPGAQVRTSMHLKGLAVDLIASNLDKLRGWLASFNASSFAKNSPYRIAGIIREPGCVHINLG